MREPAPATPPADSEPWPPHFRSGTLYSHHLISLGHAATMDLTGGRLKITSRHGVQLDVPITELTNLHSPLYTMGCGLYFETPGQRWHAAFSGVRDVDVSALRKFGPQLGLASMEIQDLANQSMLTMLWLILLDPVAPEPGAKPLAPVPPAAGSTADG